MGIQTDKDDHLNQDGFLDETIPMSWRDCLKIITVELVDFGDVKEWVSHMPFLREELRYRVQGYGDGIYSGVTETN